MSPIETTTVPRPSLHRTGDRLAAEWTRLRRQPDALAAAERWSLVDGAVTDLDQVLAAIGFEATNDDEAEHRFARLVAIAHADDLAARVVIERIRPGLLAVVRRRRQAEGDDAFDVLLGAAWEAVRTYNVDRRPACLAAALVADADYRAFRAERRRRTHDTVPLAAFDHMVDTHRPHPLEELLDLMAQARRAGLPDDDLDLLRHLIVAPTANEAAERMRVTPRTIRNRRDRVTGRLRELTLVA